MARQEPELKKKRGGSRSNRNRPHTKTSIIKRKVIDMTILSNSNRSVDAFDWRKHYSPRSDVRRLDEYLTSPDLSRAINLETYPNGGTPYGLAALAAECARVLNAAEGTRNTTLFESACRLGSLASGGELDSRPVVEELATAAKRSGLDDEEIFSTIARDDGGLQRGWQSPRNRNGFLAQQYESAVLSKALPLEWLYIGPKERWFEQLNSDEPGFGVLQVISRFESLGILYLSNYHYFLATVVSLAEKGEPGTEIAYERLVRQFEGQATEAELEGSRNLAVLRRILGSFPNSCLQSPNDRMNIVFAAKHEDLLDEVIDNATKENAAEGSRSEGVANV